MESRNDSYSPIPESRAWFLTAMLACATALVILPGIGQTAFTRAEIYFVDTARAMVERSDWLVPYFRGEPFYDKPALTYWAVAASFKLLGFTKAASRLAPAIAAVLVVVATVQLGNMLWDRRSALAGGTVLAGTAAFLAFGRTAMSDMLLALWTAVAMILALTCYRATRPGLPFVMLGLTFGLGFLTKGPIALLLPGLGILALLGLKWKSRPTIPFWAWCGAAAAFVAAGLGWFLATYLRMGWEPLNYFFLHENLQRFAGETYDPGYHWWFFAQVYLGEGMPWSLLFPLAAVHLFRRGADFGTKFLGLWIVAGVVLLSLSRGKVDYYLLPFYPAFSLLIGRYFTSVVWNRLEKNWARVVLVIMALVLAALPIFILRIPPGWRPGFPVLMAVIVTLAASSIACLGVSMRPEPPRVLLVLAIAIGVAFLDAEALILPAFYSGQPNHAIVSTVVSERQRKAELRVAIADDPTQVHRDLLFSARLVSEDTKDLVQRAESGSPYLLMVNEREASALRALPGIREVGQFPYLSNRILTLRGVLKQMEPDRFVLLANFE